MYSCDVTNFSSKLKIKATKVSKEDFLLVDMAQPYLKQPCLFRVSHFLMLNVIMHSVIMLNVMAPAEGDKKRTVLDPVDLDR